MAESESSPEGGSKVGYEEKPIASMQECPGKKRWDPMGMVWQCILKVTGNQDAEEGPKDMKGPGS